MRAIIALARRRRRRRRKALYIWEITNAIKSPFSERIECVCLYICIAERDTQLLQLRYTFSALWDGSSVLEIYFVIVEYHHTEYLFALNQLLAKWHHFRPYDGLMDKAYTIAGGVKRAPQICCELMVNIDPTQHNGPSGSFWWFFLCFLCWKMFSALIAAASSRQIWL